MKIIGRGSARGGISILHAAGLGKGCSVGVDLFTEVHLVDSEIVVEYDRHGILDSVEKCWREENLPMPSRFGWLVESSVPIGQGLKSSSALACAALRALNNSSWAGLNNSEIANLASKSQKISGCSITGSLDDAFASLEPGWKLVDPEMDASESVILEGEMDLGLSVIILLRGKRQEKLSKNILSPQTPMFERSLASIMRGSPLDSISSNGLAVAAATNDHEALRISNMCIASGAMACGISGSGPAIALVCYEEESKSLLSTIANFGFEAISTRFSSVDGISEEAI